MQNGINIITADFEDSRQIITRELYQGDYGQRIVIKGLTLPQTFEVHFSNGRNSNNKAKTVIGTNNQVEIPDEYLLTGKNIYAWVFLHQENDDGQTRYVIKIPVLQKPVVINQQPTPVQQDTITTIIAALNEAVNKSQDNLKHNPKIIEGYWYIYNAETNEYINTEIDAHGLPGLPPTITSQRVGKTTILYADGVQIARIEDGIDGGLPPPVITASKINGITTIYVNGTPIATIEDGNDYILLPQDKIQIVNLIKQDLTIPTKVSQLDNDVGYIVDPTDYITNSEIEDLLK